MRATNATQQIADAESPAPPRCETLGRKPCAATSPIFPALACLLRVSRVCAEVIWDENDGGWLECCYTPPKAERGGWPAWLRLRTKMLRFEMRQAGDC